jgi:hypothetical protein
MIESIRQADNGYYIRTDKEEIYIDYIEIHDIIAYDNERIVGYNDDGKLAIMNTTTHECETLTKFEVNYKRYSITLCGNQKCWYQCSNPDEEYYYAKVFDYLGKCPEFNYIPDLIAYLLSEYIKLVDLETASEHISYFLSPTYCPLEMESAGDVDYNSSFEMVLQLTKLIVDIIENEED